MAGLLQNRNPMAQYEGLLAKLMQSQGQPGTGLLDQLGEVEIPAPRFRPRIREPFPGELKFFRSNPEVAGIATDDDAITLNPFSQLDEDQRSSVILNEASRLYMRKFRIAPKFQITPEQRAFFLGMQQKGVPAERADEDIRETIVGRILSNDPSAQNATPEQIDFTNKLRKFMELDR